MENAWRKPWVYCLVRLICATLVTLFLGVAGVFLFDGIKGKGIYDLFSLAAFAGMLVLLFSLICSPILASNYAKYKMKRPAAELIGELTRQADRIRENYQKAKKKLLKLRILISVYILFVFLLTAYIALFSFCETSLVPYFFSLVAFFGLFLHVYNPKPAPDFSEYAKAEEYPRIYALARRAAERVGVRGDIKILLQSGMSAGIAKFGKAISLEVGVTLFSFLREEEVYQIFLHEFAHIKNVEKEAAPIDAFSSFLDMGVEGLNPLITFLGCIFAFPYSFYGYEVMLYKVMASVIIEGLADKKMAELGNGQHAANALAKTAIYDCYDEKLDLYMGYPVMQSEECPKNFSDRVYQNFLRLLPEKEELWRSLIDNEIQARSASHPVVRFRIQAMGVEGYQITPPEKEGAYFDECQKARAYVDELIYKRIVDGYEEGRKEHYLQPLEKVQAWEAEGRPYDRETVRDVIENLLSLFRYDEALVLCEEILQKEEGGIVAYAKYTRGNIRLENFDKRGIEDLYDAMKENNNYIDGALSRIGTFCCRMGLQEELEEYRANAVIYAQQQMDEEGVSSLTPADMLSEENVLPSEVLEANKQFIINAGEGNISRIFLVRKKVTERYTVSAYVVEFLPHTEWEKQRDAMDKIFVYLDNGNADYALFTYDKNAAAAVKKVANSCIYQK